MLPRLFNKKTKCAEVLPVSGFKKDDPGLVYHSSLCHLALREKIMWKNTIDHVIWVVHKKCPGNCGRR